MATKWDGWHWMAACMSRIVTSFTSLYFHPAHCGRFTGTKELYKNKQNNLKATTKLTNHGNHLEARGAPREKQCSKQGPMAFLPHTCSNKRLGSAFKSSDCNSAMQTFCLDCLSIWCQESCEFMPPGLTGGTSPYPGRVVGVSTYDL